MDSAAESRRNSISLIHMSPETTLAAAEKGPANTPESQSRFETAMATAMTMYVLLLLYMCLALARPATDLLLGQDMPPSYLDAAGGCDKAGALTYTDDDDDDDDDDGSGQAPRQQQQYPFKFATLDEERLHIARLSSQKSRFVAIRVVRIDGQTHKSITAEVRVPTSISSFTQLYKKVGR